MPPKNDADAPGRAGPPPAFLLLLTSCQSTLYAAGAALLGGAEGAHDVLQETNVVLMEKAAEYDPARPFVPWALAFARFQVMAWRKRQARDRLVLDDATVALLADRLAAPAAPPSLNLDLTQARSRTERGRTYDAEAADIRATLARAEQPPEERTLAEALLENGSFLAANDAPLAEADRFGAIAELLIARLEAATAARDEGRAVRLAETYGRVTDLGVDANLDRARAAAPPGPERARKLDRAARGSARRAGRLAEVLDRDPNPSAKAAHRALKGRHHRTKKHHKHAP